MGRNFFVSVIASSLTLASVAGCSDSAIDLDAKAEAIAKALAGVEKREDFVRIASEQRFDCSSPAPQHTSCWWQDPEAQFASAAPGIRVAGTFVDGVKSGEFEITTFVAGQ